jgi:hypothetical protein
MKTYQAFLLGCCLAVPALSQGQINFGNRISIDGIDAPVFDVDCTTRLEGPAYLAQPYAGLTPDSLSPVGVVLAFRTGEQAGYVSALAVNVPGVGAGALVYAQLRAWEAGAGTSFEAAVAAGGKYGISNIVPMRTVVSPDTPYSPIGLQSFCLVPEPGAGALLVLGGGLWLLLASRRRRPSTSSAAGPDPPSSAP